MMDIPDEIKEARKLLEDAERSNKPERKAILLEEGLDKMESYVDEHQNLSDSVLNFISNIRIAHTRRLLIQLSSIQDIEIGLWFEYTKILFLRLKKECETIFAEDSRLKEIYDAFVDVWREDFKKLIGLEDE